jgi:hypothetical protein
MAHLKGAGSEVISLSPSANQEQTVIGWLEK